MIEEAIAKKMSSINIDDKTFIDKVLGREDIREIKRIINKEVLTSKDISQLLYLVNSAEQKLYNFSEDERKVVGKFFVWLREVAVQHKHLYEYEEQLKNCTSKTDETTKKILDDMKKKLTHCVTFMADVLFFMCRSSLSVGGVGFKEVLKNKFEIVYGSEEKNKKKIGLF